MTTDVGNIRDVLLQSMSAVKGSRQIELRYPVSRESFELAWHYTDAAGLESILRTNRLWAGAMLALNDSRELEYGAELAQEVWATMEKDGIEESTREILDVVMARFGDEYRGVFSSNAYVLSASTEGDLLNQWHHYAGRGGFSIGLDVGPNLVPSDHPWGAVLSSSAPLSGHWGAVEYDPKFQRKYLSDLLTELTVLCSLSDGEEEGEGDPIGDQFYQYILAMVCQLKDRAFRDEREVRYITGTGEMAESELFRVAGGQIHPYVRLGATSGVAGPVVFDKDALLPIRAITIGPTSDETSEPVITRLLAKYKHHEVKVLKSNVSLRG